MRSRVHSGLKSLPSSPNYAEFSQYKIFSSVNEMVNSTKRIHFFITKSEGIITLQRAPISALSLPSGSKLCTSVEYTIKCFFFFWSSTSRESLHLLLHGRDCECRLSVRLTLCANVLLKAASRCIRTLTFDSAHSYSLLQYHPCTPHTVCAHGRVIYLYNNGF